MMPKLHYQSIVPNVVTCLRLLGIAILLLIEPLSLPFFLLYTFCGVSDVLDGMLARAWHTQSTFGSRLDSIADLLFYAGMIWMILPFMMERLSTAIWCLGFAAVGVHTASYITALIKFHCFASVHTYGNKITGLLVFLMPYVMGWQNGRWFQSYCIFAGILACIFSLEEWLIHLTSSTYNGQRKSLFFIKTQN